jgi:hypothetical protein
LAYIRGTGELRDNQSNRLVKGLRKQGKRLTSGKEAVAEMQRNDRHNIPRK